MIPLAAWYVKLVKLCFIPNVGQASPLPLVRGISNSLREGAGLPDMRENLV